MFKTFKGLSFRALATKICFNFGVGLLMLSCFVDFTTTKQHPASLGFFVSGLAFLIACFLNSGLRIKTRILLFAISVFILAIGTYQIAEVIQADKRIERVQMEREKSDIKLKEDWEKYLKEKEEKSKGQDNDKSSAPEK